MDIMTGVDFDLIASSSPASLAEFGLLNLVKAFLPNSYICLKDIIPG